jgi:hypothetical protein
MWLHDIEHGGVVDVQKAISADEKPDIRLKKNVLQFGLGVPGIECDHGRAQVLSGEISNKPLDAVAHQDADLVTPPNALGMHGLGAIDRKAPKLREVDRTALERNGGTLRVACRQFLDQARQGLTSGFSQEGNPAISPWA